MNKPGGRGFDSRPGQSFPLSLCGPNCISRANVHMVYMGRKLALHITLYHAICSKYKCYTANVCNKRNPSSKYKPPGDYTWTAITLKYKVKQSTETIR